jgi:hypothetical protein
MAKRLARNERSDTKRYHTAGAIEDIKKENSRDKDAAIHKRLSWNYGPQQQVHTHHNLQPGAMKNRQFFSCESMGSVRSSSGVSSTSSLLNCISHSDLETTHEVVEPRDPRLPDVLIAVSEPEPEPLSPSPHEEQDQLCNFCESERGYKCRCSSASEAEPLSPAPQICSACTGQNESYGSVSSCPSSPKPSPRKPTTGASGGVLIMKDFILTDASIEASEV